MRTLCMIITFVCVMSLHGQSVSEIVQLIRSGRIEEAETMLNMLKSEEDDSDNLLFLDGLISIEADSAVLMYQELLNRFPQSDFADDARFRLGLYSYARGLYKAAVQHFKRVLIDYPKSKRYYQKSNYWIAQCYLATEQKDTAEYYLKFTINNFPKTAVTAFAERDLKNLQPEARTVKPKKTERDDNQKITAGDKKFTIQVGAFAIQTSANLRKAYFERFGYKVRIKSRKKNGKRLYRVWIGSYPSKAEAEQIAEKIKKDHKCPYIIVAE